MKFRQIWHQHNKIGWNKTTPCPSVPRGFPCRQSKHQQRAPVIQKRPFVMLHPSSYWSVNFTTPSALLVVEALQWPGDPSLVGVPAGGKELLPASAVQHKAHPWHVGDLWGHIRHTRVKTKTWAQLGPATVETYYSLWSFPAAVYPKKMTPSQS